MKACKIYLIKIHGSIYDNKILVPCFDDEKERMVLKRLSELKKNNDRIYEIKYKEEEEGKIIDRLKRIKKILFNLKESQN